MSALNKSFVQYSLGVIFLLLVAGLGYIPSQKDFHFILPFFSGLFVIYLLLCQRMSTQKHFTFWIGIAIISRIILVGSLPNLSDDVYRFVWDGRLLVNGFNPFEHLPGYYLSADLAIPGIDQSLFEQLNSPEYFTVYPPVCQYIFATATWLFPNSFIGNVIAIKIFFLLFEIGSIGLIIKILQVFKMPIQRVFWYAMNPLIIIELIGNLHFEVAMIFFLLAALWYYQKEHFTLSAVAIAGAIGAKLLPLIFLPFFIKRLGWKKSLYYFSVVGTSLLILFLPLLNTTLISNIGSSVGLYFQRFEFNASIYYLLRWVGFQYAGYNMIQQIGPLLALVVFLGICWLAWREKDLSTQHLIKQMLFALTLFLICATTVMPWYLSGLIALSVFTDIRYPIVWSYLIMLTYINYAYPVFRENGWIVGFEYLVVAGIIWRERKE